MCLSLVILILSLSSCEFVERYLGSHIQNRPENQMYGAVKVLYSYDEVMSALDIVRERVDVKPCYTVDNMGDDYTVLYYFIREGLWTEYPIDYDDYFHSTSNGLFITYIFLNNTECPGHENHGICAQSSFSINKFDEDYEKLSKYKSCAGVTLNANSVVTKIEDVSLLSYGGHYGDGGGYFIYYDGTKIFTLSSCIELDEVFFEVLFENIVTTSKKE